MANEQKRVLGRVLATEEVKAVCGGGNDPAPPPAKTGYMSRQYRWGREVDFQLIAAGDMCDWEPAPDAADAVTSPSDPNG